MLMLKLARSRALIAAAALSGAISFSTPAVADPAVVTPTSDPCSAGYVQGALACQGYYGGNLLQGSAGDATPTDIQAIINTLLTGTPTPTDTASGYTPPYMLDTSQVLARFDQTGSTIDFGTLMNGLTVFGAHFGNNTDSSANNVTAFWLVNFTQPTTSITLLNGGVVTTAGTSNAELFATGVQAPLPEPATWAMMLFGFGGIGVAMRRRRQKSGLMQVA